MTPQERATLCTVLAIASGHRPHVFRRLLAVYWASPPFVLSASTSGPHARSLEHYLEPRTRA